MYISLCKCTFPVMEEPVHSSVPLYDSAFIDESCVRLSDFAFRTEREVLQVQYQVRIRVYRTGNANRTSQTREWIEPSQ